MSVVSRHHLAGALLVAGFLALAACTAPGAPSSEGTPERPRSGEPAASRSPTRDTEGTGQPVPRSEILEDLRGAVASSESYWAAQFAAEGLAFERVRRVYPYVPGDGTSCGGRPNVPRNAAYCRPNDDIAFDIQWTARAYRVLGDAFVYYLIGHEYAHAIQARLGTTLDYTIEYELQADCYAGASIGDQMRAGVLVLEDGDIAELKAGLRAVADPEGTPWFDPRAHGTAEQRIRYFGTGFDDSLDACP